jgi:hypothetical protein
VTVLKGGRDVSDADLESRALQHAKARGISVAGLKALHVPLSAVRGDGVLKVSAEGTALAPATQSRRQALAEQRAMRDK